MNNGVGVTLPRISQSKLERNAPIWIGILNYPGLLGSLFLLYWLAVSICQYQYCVIIFLTIQIFYDFQEIIAHIDIEIVTHLNNSLHNHCYHGQKS